MSDLIDDDVAGAFGLDPWDDAPESGEFATEPEALTDPAEVRELLTSPGAFTIVSRSSGARFRFRLTEPKQPKSDDVRLFLGLLSGPAERYDYLGTVWTAASYYRRRRWDAGYAHAKRSSIDPGSPAARAVEWLYGRAVGRSDEALVSALSQCEVWR